MRFIIIIFLFVYFGQAVQAKNVEYYSDSISIYHLNTKELKNIKKHRKENKITKVELGEKITDKDLELLGKLTWIEELKFDSFTSNKLNIAPIANLKKLKLLRVSIENNINIHPLEKLINLESLEFSNLKQGIDCKYLKNLTKLKYLRLHRIEGISDLTHLVNLNNLEHFKAYGSEFKNIEAISQLKNLKILEINRCKTTTIDYISSLTKLEKLDIQEYVLTIDNTNSLIKLKNLKEIVFCSNKYSNENALLGLKYLKSLESLTLYDTNLTNLEVLSNCINIKNLSIVDSSNLRDISVVSKMKKLEYLNIKNSSVSSLAPLKNCVNLIELDISETQIANVSYLKKSKNLKIIYAYKTPIEDISVFSTMKNLYDLNIRKTAVKSLSPLKKCLKLNTLNIRETPVKKLSDLYTCKNLWNMRFSKYISKKERDKFKKKFPKIDISEYDDELYEHKDIAQVAEEEPAQVAEEEPAQVAKEEPAQVAKEEPAQVAKEEPAQIAKEKPAQVADEEPAQVAIKRVRLNLATISVAEKIKQALNFTSKTNPNWVEIKKGKIVPLWKKLKDITGVFVLKKAIKPKFGNYLKVTGNIQFIGQAYFSELSKKFRSVEQSFAKSATSLIIYHTGSKYQIYKNEEKEPFYEISGVTMHEPHFFIKGNIQTSESGNKKFEDIK